MANVHYTNVRVFDGGGEAPFMGEVLVQGDKIARVVRSASGVRAAPVGGARVVDGAGRPLDRLGPIGAQELRPLQSRPFNPIERAPIDTTLDVGVRAINTLLTVGRGQRLGLFAGSGPSIVDPYAPRSMKLCASAPGPRAKTNVPSFGCAKCRLTVSRISAFAPSISL